MTITVLVPVYGVEKYIAECAHSLFRQTYPDIEYVFCDDCTPDRSMEILHEVVEQYPERKEHVRIIKNDVNKGLGGTRVHLISEIKTDYFMIVDSDDVLPEKSVESLVNRMKETDTDIVDSGYAEYSGGKPTIIKYPSHLIGMKYVKAALVQNLVSLRVWGKLYKTKVIEKVPELFVEGIDFAEDVCASSRLVAVTTRSWTDEIAYYYRTDNISSYTQNISKKNILSYFRATKKILSFYHLRGHLTLALETGVLNAYRESCKSKIDVKKADEIIQYIPEHISARLLFRLFHCKSKALFKLADFLYRIVRTLAIM